MIGNTIGQGPAEYIDDFSRDALHPTIPCCETRRVISNIVIQPLL
jgi:hypothetical protein